MSFVKELQDLEFAELVEDIKEQCREAAKKGETSIEVRVGHRTGNIRGLVHVLKELGLNVTYDYTGENWVTIYWPHQ